MCSSQCKTVLIDPDADFDVVLDVFVTNATGPLTCGGGAVLELESTVEQTDDFDDADAIDSDLPDLVATASTETGTVTVTFPADSEPGHRIFTITITGSGVNLEPCDRVCTVSVWLVSVISIEDISAARCGLPGDPSQKKYLIINNTEEEREVEFTITSSQTSSASGTGSGDHFPIAFCDEPPPIGDPEDDVNPEITATVIVPEGAGSAVEVCFNTSSFPKCHPGSNCIYELVGTDLATGDEVGASTDHTVVDEDWSGCPTVPCIPVLACSAPNLDIGFDLDPTIDEIFIGEDGVVVDLNVFIDISHPWNGDMDILLQSPQNTQLLLAQNNLDGDQEDILVVFDDQGEPYDPLQLNANIAMQPFQPIFGLAGLFDYYAEPMNGSWFLTVTDFFLEDDGTLNEWCLDFICPSPCAVLPPTELNGVRIGCSLELSWVLDPDQFYDGVLVAVDGRQLALLPGDATSYLHTPDGDGAGSYQVVGFNLEEQCGAPSDPWDSPAWITPMGVDLWQLTEGSRDFSESPIPAGFFGVGSEAFSGNIDLCGNPLGTRGAFELGLTDTVIMRNDPFCRCDFPCTDGPTVDIELVELSLKSCAPITVVTEGADVLWDVEVTLSDDTEDTSGSFTFSFDAEDAGTYDTELFVKPIFVFSREGFVRGDPNGDSFLDLADAFVTLVHLFLDGIAECADAMDFDDDGEITLTGDVLGLLEYMYSGGVPPADPFPLFGPDPTDDDLGCDNPIVDTRELADLGLVELTGTGAPWDLDTPCYEELLVRFTTSSDNYCPRVIDVEGDGFSLSYSTPLADPDRPGGDVDETAEVDESASIGRGATIGAGAVVGPDVIIGPNANVSAGATIGQGACIGANSEVGADSIIGARVIVDDDCKIGENCTIGEDTTLRQRCTLESDVSLGARGDFNVDSFFDVFVDVGDDCRFGDNVSLGDSAVVLDGIVIEAGGSVDAGAILEEDLLQCTVDLDAEGRRVGTIFECEDADGAILGSVPLKFRGELFLDLSEVPIDPEDLPDELADLQDKVNSAGEDDPRGPIKDRPYVKDTYDCDDFASDMEKALEECGLDATMTIYWEYEDNPDHSWWNWLWTSEYKLKTAHAITDVHTDDGIIFIEPQTGEIGIDLDCDGDGDVEYESSHGSTTDFTDGMKRIEVYDDRASAEAAGVVMD